MNNPVCSEWLPRETKLLVSTAFLLGIVIGFMFAPIKKGIYCGNYNGNTQHLPEDSAPVAAKERGRVRK